MNVCVIDYGAGNLYSVLNALKVVDKPPTTTITLAKTAKQVHDATHIILPGVGSFAGCMEGLLGLEGMVDALSSNVQQRKKPFLGICVGMQMLFELSEEHGEHEGLGWLKGKVTKILPEKEEELKIPHMGWNTLTLRHKDSAMFQGIVEGEHAYFVHSYHCVPEEEAIIAATVDYDGSRVAAVQKENIYATQFHPEKSQQTGLRLLENFLQLQPV